MAALASRAQPAVTIPDVPDDGVAGAPGPAASPHLLRLQHVVQVGFSPDGRVLMTLAEDDHQVHFWNAADGQEVNRFGFAVTGAQFSADGTRVITWGTDNVVRVFDTRTGKALRRLAGAGEGVRAVAISADGTRALTAAAGELPIKFWDATTGELIAALDGQASPATAVGLSPDGKRAVSLSGVAAVVGGPQMTSERFSSGAYRRPTTQPLATRPAPATAPVDVALRVWDLEKRTVTRKIDLPAPAQAGPYFSKDGNLALVAVAGAARIYDLTTAQDVARPRTADEAFAAGSFTGDRKTGLRKAVAQAAITDAATGQDVRPLEGPIDGLPLCNAFSADGARVVLGTGKVALFSRRENEPGVVYAHDMATGKRLARFDGHGREVQWVAVAPDGKRAASRDGGKTLFLWAIP